MNSSGTKLPKSKMLLQILAVIIGCATLTACCDQSVVNAVICGAIGIPFSGIFPTARKPVAKAIGRNSKGFRPRPATGQATVPEIAPFFGNLSTVPLPADPTAAILAGLVRQSDCSLTLMQASYTASAQGNPTITVLPATPHYEKVLAANAFLTTTPDQFPNGCVDPSLGTTSNIFQFLGQGKNGQTLLALPAANGVSTQGVSAGQTTFPSMPTIQMTPTPPITITSGDLNKDGNPDIVSVNTDGLNGSISVFLGNSDGTYKPALNLALPNEQTQYAVIDDLNNDGNLDIVAISGSGFSIFLGNGDGTFKPVQNVTPAGSNLNAFAGLITADVNGDGKKDIITADGQVFLGAGDGVTFTLVPTRSFTVQSAGASPAAPAIVSADFNNDKKVDVAVDDGSAIHIFLGNGDGTFKTGPVYSTISDLGFIFAVDLNGDGNVDIWSGFAGKGLYGADQESLVAYALMGNGDGTFQGAPDLPVKYAQTNLADLNGDGRPDLVSFTLNSTNQSVLNTYLTQANGIPKLEQQLVLPVGTPGGTPVLGKFVGSTTYDAFWVGVTPILPTLNVSAGNGDGSFALPTTVTAPSLVPSGVDNQQDITGVLTADMNHDGKADLVYTFFDIDGVSGFYEQGIAVQLGNGDGTFQKPVITLTYNSKTALFDSTTSQFAGIFDVNKDNFPDVFLVIPGAIVNGTEQHTLQVFISNGDGTFKMPATLAVTPNLLETDAGYGSPLAFADLNGDGNVDLVVSGSSSDATTPMFAVAIGNGDGTFKAPTLFTVEGFGYPGGPAIADFDGDGKLDLALQGAIESGGGIFPGNGDGTFQSITNTDKTISPPDAIALAVSGGAVAEDFNKDGKTDLMFGGVILLNETGATPPSMAATSTGVTAAPNPAAAGATVTLTATVTSTTAGTITGTVTFLDGGTSIGTGTVGAGGVATLMTSTLAAGSHPITASYGGDANYSGSVTATAVTLVINGAGKAATTAAVASSLNPSTAGASVTFTATVTSATAGTITGTVTFFDNGTQIGTGTLSGGKATFATSTLTTGTHPITASYGGDANYAASAVSTAVSQVVNASTKATTNTTVSSSANPSTVGASVTFTAMVTSATAGTITGTVTFFDGATQLGTGTLAAGSATLMTSTLTAGSHSITASYGGDANYAASAASPAVTQVVNAAAGDFSVVAMPGSVTVAAGTSGMVGLTVTPANGSTQTVTFSCTGLPAGAACGFVPPSVTLDGTHAATSAMTITTTGPTAGVRVSSAGTGTSGAGPRLDGMAASFGVGLLGIFGLVLFSPRESVRRAALLVAVLTIPAMALVACGGSGSSGGGGTPAGTYTVSVTATAGTDTHAVPVTLTVN
jgi:Bacterial Ig-like domain (group 3)/FG-GAP-like repeat